MGHYVSFVIHSWQDGDEGAMRWSVRSVNDAVSLRVPTASFVVRTWVDDEQVVRGLIRHVQSGREVQFQSGRNALDLLRSWIENAGPPDGAGLCTPEPDPSLDRGEGSTDG
ncbi:MAG: hypothetical protein JXA09_02180 [Anaerolineae bacterium]|nr:hypothetical protein [Anaerolineae bacterium]